MTTWTDAVAAPLTPVARARAIAAATPGAGYAESLIDAPFAEAWPRIADLERSVPAADRLVAGLRVRSRRPAADGSGAEELRLTAWSPLRIPQPFDVRLEDGFCLMVGRARSFLVVMAAMPEPGDPGRTRFAHVEAVPRRIGRPLRRVFARTTRADVAGFSAWAAGSG